MEIDDPPHALVISFQDEDNDFEVSSVIVYAENYGPEELRGGDLSATGGMAKATHFRDIDLPGVTNRLQAWNHGNYLLNIGRKRARSWAVSMDFENLASRRGDWVKFRAEPMDTDYPDSPGLNRPSSAGLVTAVSDDGTIHVNQPCDFNRPDREKQATFRVRVLERTLEDGTEEGRYQPFTFTVRTPADPLLDADGFASSFVLEEPTAHTLIRPGDLFAFGTARRDFHGVIQPNESSIPIDCRIAAIESIEGLHARLTLEPNPDVQFLEYDSQGELSNRPGGVFFVARNMGETGPIPVGTPRLPAPPAPAFSKAVSPTIKGPPPPRLFNLRSDESALPENLTGARTPVIRMGIAPGVPDSGNANYRGAASFNVRFRPSDSTDPEDYTYATALGLAREIVLEPVAAQVAYLIEAQAISADGGESIWTPVTHIVTGLGGPPPDVPSLQARPGEAGTQLIWPYSAPPGDLAGFHVRYSRDPSVRDWGGMQEIRNDIPATERQVSVTAGGGVYAIRAVDTGGNLSVNPEFAVTGALGRPLQRVSTQTEAPAFPGAKTDMEVVISQLRLERKTLPANNPRIMDLTNVKGERRGLNAPESQYYDSPGVYETAVVDLGAVYKSARAEADVYTPGIVVDSDEMTTWDSLTELESMATATITQDYSVRSEVRTATTLSGGTYNWLDWAPLATVGYVEGRYVQFRLVVTLADGIDNVTPSISRATFTLDLARRDEQGAEAGATGSDKTIPFGAKFHSAPGMQFSIRSGAAGDYVDYSQTESDFTFSVRNSAGNRIDKTVDWFAYGFGERA